MEHPKMNEIICPSCNEKFKIDETAYINIVKQVHDSEFDNKLKERLKEVEKTKNAELEVSKKNLEIDIEKIKYQKDLEIEKLKSANKDSIKEIEKDRDKLEIDLKNQETSLKEKYLTQIKDRDDAIERLKDMKAKLSTKMVGESLEQHCEIEFSKLRSTAFQKSFFEKDNDISTGSKGDFIFKDYDENGNEIISIMFEMKNETDTTATKSKNEDFLKELDKDRNEKNCEYAILVSLLEADNELYNTGIVDVFHRYKKMYVIRPQFFIPIITILRNAAMHSLKFKTELAEIREQNIDVTNFETELEIFKKDFGRNYDLASRQFSSAIEQIDKSIRTLQNTKKELLSAENNLRLANNKSQEVTIKRLTRNNPTMAQKFNDLNKS